MLPRQSSHADADVTEVRIVELVDDGPPMTHLYPQDPWHRRSGERTPRVGDIARCGHVKEKPSQHWVDYDRCPLCLVCDEMARAAGTHPND